MSDLAPNELWQWGFLTWAVDNDICCLLYGLWYDAYYVMHWIFWGNGFHLLVFVFHFVIEVFIVIRFAFVKRLPSEQNFARFLERASPNLRVVVFSLLFLFSQAINNNLTHDYSKHIKSYAQLSIWKVYPYFIFLYTHLLAWVQTPGYPGKS